MLIDFYVSNFKSFDYSEQDNQGICMIPSSIRSKPDHVNDLALLRSSVIFGANSSGKSNLIEAIGFVKNIITDKDEIDKSNNTLCCLCHSQNKNRTSRFSFHIHAIQPPEYLQVGSDIMAMKRRYDSYDHEYIYEIEVKLEHGGSYEIISETVWKVDGLDTVELFSYHIDLDESYYRASWNTVLEAEKLNELIRASSEFGIIAADYEERIRKLEFKLENDSNDGLNETPAGQLEDELAKLRNNYYQFRVKHSLADRESLEKRINNARGHFQNETMMDPALSHKFHRESIICPNPDYAKLKKKYNFDRKNASTDEIEDAISSIYRWFNQTLVVLNPHKFVLPNMNADSFEQLSGCISEFDVGIRKLVWNTVDDQYSISRLVRDIDQHDRELISKCQWTSMDSPIECSVIVGDLTGLYMISFWHGEYTVKKMMTLHDGDPTLHDLIEESNGTRRLIELCSVLVNQRSDRVYVVDEFDCRLHPLVSRRFVEKFYEKQKKLNNAQLIVSTHETRLMTTDLFRLDEIWLVDRDKDGCTHVRNAADSMKTPYHKRLDKLYLVDQVMGGVPNLKRLDHTED